MALSMILFCSCSNSCYQWKLDEGIGIEDCYDSRRLYLMSEGIADRLVLEVIQSKSGVRVYFDTFSGEFPSILDDPDKAQVNICFELSETAFIADRLLGGQRLLLPMEAVELMLSTLMNGEDFVIKVGRYRMKVTTANFAEQFNS